MQKSLKLFNDPKFIAEHKQSSTAFTRNRKLTFQNTALFIMNLLKSSLQDELDLFFKHINNTEFEERYVSKAAFCKARNKLSYTTFVDANRNLIDSFYKKVNYKTWNDFRVTAIDGSTLKLPSTNDVADNFGRRNPSEVPQARLSSRFDVLNKICLEMFVTPWNSDERNLAHQHLASAESNDLMLYDRGYPCFSLYADHKEKNCHFLMRLAKNWSRETKQFEDSSCTDKIITLTAVRPETKLRCMNNGVSFESIKVRLLKIRLSTGENELLVTSLTDKKRYPLKSFKELYALRWGVEEDYKTKKVWMEYENFSGKSTESVYQDIFAKLYTQNIVSIISFQTETLLSENRSNRKYTYQVNKAQAISKIKNNIFRFLKYGAIKFVKSLIKLYYKTAEPIRKNRHANRQHKMRTRYFYPQYKTTR